MDSFDLSAACDALRKAQPTTEEAFRNARAAGNDAATLRDVPLS